MQKERIEGTFRGGWSFTAVEMVKRNGEWGAHFILKKTVTFTDNSTLIAIDIGEKNLAVAVAISKDNPLKPMRGQFWKGSEIKRIRRLYSHIRRRLGEKKLLKKIKAIGRKEERKVNQQLHILANQVVEYAKQFPKALIVMEGLNGLGRMKFTKKVRLNGRKT